MIGDVHETRRMTFLGFRSRLFCLLGRCLSTLPDYLDEQVREECGQRSTDGLAKQEKFDIKISMTAFQSMDFVYGT